MFRKSYRCFFGGQLPRSCNHGALVDLLAGRRSPFSLRNKMYLTADTIRLLAKERAKFTAAETSTPKSHTDDLQHGARYIPLWVKAFGAVHLRSGLGSGASRGVSGHAR